MENSSIGIPPPVSITQDLFAFFRRAANLSAIKSGTHIDIEDINTGPRDSNEWALLVVYGGVMGALNVLGVLTNCITIYVFSRYPTKSSTYLLLQILALADAVFLIFNTLELSCHAIHIFIKSFQHYLNVWAPALNYLKGSREISRDYAVWMVVLVTIDRYFGICHPMKATRINTPRRALLAAGSLLLAICAYNVPMFLMMKVNVHIPASYDYSELAKDKTFGAFYFITDATINLLVPIVLVITMNAAIVCGITKARRMRYSMTSRSCDKGKSSNHTNIMLVVVATVFVFCEVPKIVEEVLYFTGRELTYTEQKHNIPFPISMTSEFLQNLSSFVNFYVYCLVGRKFRRILASGIRRSKCCGAEDSSAQNNESKTVSFSLLSIRKRFPSVKKQGSQSGTI